MRVFTSHLKPGTAPILLREGFSLAASVFGCLWFLWQLAWIPAALALALQILITRAGGPYAGAWLTGLILLEGCFGRDLVRWSLALRGYEAGPVVVAADLDSALARLLTERGDLFVKEGVLF